MLENNYVLITAAYNEAVHIGSTIEAVLKQTIKPLKWTIVSDGSSDGTDSIIQAYANRFRFIEFLRREKTNDDPGFISKVKALKIGYVALTGMSYRFIGILDADITFAPKYYENIISNFRKNPILGIAGGFIYERDGSIFKSRFTNSTTSVAGAIQLFRRECYEVIGGHHPARFGGEDTICEVAARMQGWEVQSFPEMIVYHHKPGQSKRGIFRDVIRQGRVDFTIGNNLLFEVAKCLRRIRQKPYFLASLLRMSGYMVSYLVRDNRVVSKEFVDYLQCAQLKRIKKIFRFD
jgi:glycosyltransferase involved in cell wall biosynthesis